MAEIFLGDEAISLLKGKKVLLLGDSNVRALYKDLIWLLKCNNLIDINFLRRRLEKNFLEDELIHRSRLTRGRDYTEHRRFTLGNTVIEFIFLTRCYSRQVEDLFYAFKDGKKEAPDVIYMNSTLWDITRWGPTGVKEFRINMRQLMQLIKESLPPRTLFLWGTAIPTASSTSGGLIIKQIEFLQATLRVQVLEANRFTSSIVSSFGFDVIDFHYFMHYQVTRRCADGIHFLPHAMRFMTNLLLTHIALSWDVRLPSRTREHPLPLDRILKAAHHVPCTKVEAMVEEMDKIASNIIPQGRPALVPPAKARKLQKKNRNMKTFDLNPTEAGLKTPPMYQKAEANDGPNRPQFSTPEFQNSLFSLGPTSFPDPRIDESRFSEDNYEPSVANTVNNTNHPVNTVADLIRNVNSLFSIIRGGTNNVTRGVEGQESWVGSRRQTEYEPAPLRWVWDRQVSGHWDYSNSQTNRYNQYAQQTSYQYQYGQQPGPSNPWSQVRYNAPSTSNYNAATNWAINYVSSNEGFAWQNQRNVWQNQPTNNENSGAMRSGRVRSRRRHFPYQQRPRNNYW